MLKASGRAVQTKDKIHLSASRGVVIGELSFKTGEPDYTLFVDGKAIGATEAEPEGDTFIQHMFTSQWAESTFSLPPLARPQSHLLSPLSFSRSS